MNVTIATHNGSKVAREHNIREEKVVSKENHIDLNRVHEIWVDEKPQDAYRRLFEKSRLEYNAKQTREDRKIQDYYKDICKNEKKHAVYEMIIGVYGKDKNGRQICDDETGKQIMKEFVESWQDRNPNLELIGAYYHADEDGEPHVHLDYIPVAHGYSRGMETQTGLVKALGEMGFQKQGKATAQIQWQARENKALEEICNEYGLEVDHPREAGRQHIDTELYKAQEAAKTAIDNAKDLLDQQDEMRAKIRHLEAQRDKINNQVKKALERKEKAFSRSFKKDKSGEGWTYDRTLEKEIKEITASIKQEVNQISHTNADVQVQYDMAEQARIRAEEHAAEKKKEADKILKEAQELREQERGYILGTAQNMANQKVQDFIQKEFSQDKGGRTARLEKFCDSLQMNNGMSVLDRFNQLEKELKEKTKRSWGMER